MLEVKGLSIAYGNHLAVKDVSLSVSPGEVVAIIGPNGAGKSTIIRAISGVVSKTSGQIQFSGADLSSLKPVERAKILAVVPQARQLGGAFTVEQSIMMGRTAHMNWLGQAQEADHNSVKQAMQDTNTLALADRKLAELSGGEQQRVLLARALAQKTPVLVLDEPTNHLDLQHQTIILSLVRKQAIENGLAVFMALHDLNLVSLYADRVALIVDGKLTALGEPKEVLKEQKISEAYNISVQVFEHPDYQMPIIFPNSNR